MLVLTVLLWIFASVAGVAHAIINYATSTSVSLSASSTSSSTTSTQSNTSVWVTLTVDGTPTTVETIYSQSFASFFTTISSPKSGAIGLGTLSGSVGYVKPAVYTTITQ